jgi:hypothetical protein
MYVNGTEVALGHVPLRMSDRDQSEQLQAELSRYAISNYRGAKKLNSAWLSFCREIGNLLICNEFRFASLYQDIEALVLR